MQWAFRTTWRYPLPTMRSIASYRELSKKQLLFSLYYPCQKCVQGAIACLREALQNRERLSAGSGQITGGTQLIDTSKPEKFHEVECMFFLRSKKPQQGLAYECPLLRDFLVNNRPSATMPAITAKKASHLDMLPSDIFSMAGV